MIGAGPSGRIRTTSPLPCGLAVCRMVQVQMLRGLIWDSDGIDRCFCLKWFIIGLRNIKILQRYVFIGVISLYFVSCALPF
jgi:hypothetical protein